MGFGGGGGGGGGGSVPAIAFGDAADRPAPAAINANTAYFARDTNEVTFSDGAEWNVIGSVSGAFSAVQVNVSSGANVGGHVELLDEGSVWVSPDSGSGSAQGAINLIGGVVTVNNTQILNTTRIFLTAQDNDTIGSLQVSNRVEGVSFDITSSVPTDTGLVGWLLFQVPD